MGGWVGLIGIDSAINNDNLLTDRAPHPHPSVLATLKWYYDENRIFPI